MMMYLVALSQKLGGDVPKFRPPQPSPQVPPNYFSSPINQGTPLGDAQGWLGSNAPEFHLTASPLLPAKDHHLEMLRGSQPQQWIYPTQGPPFGDTSQSQPPPQWMYPGQPMMMYHGQQPMFYPTSQPSYYMPWRSTAPPMTPPDRP
ncbi:hypothetical protein U9M48_027414 [Paspalum notatum var. saurae]|uniref:Uncharacterized protein n=1 Tax=Paspalum notatum var. saurae TaxID=547442 RepID=A0AAQ3WZF0_PASNO